MARTTAELIAGIVEVDPNITDLTPFIDAAAALVASQCEGITDETGTLVETWLGAHFYGIRDQRVASEAVSGVSQSYQYKLDLGLMITHYGQTAMSLDDTGGLAKWNDSILKGKSGKGASIAWLGTAP